MTMYAVGSVIGVELVLWCVDGPHPWHVRGFVYSMVLVALVVQWSWSSEP